MAVADPGFLAWGSKLFWGRHVIAHF